MDTKEVVVLKCQARLDFEMLQVRLEFVSVDESCYEIYLDM